MARIHLYYWTARHPIMFQHRLGLPLVPGQPFPDDGLVVIFPNDQLFAVQIA